MRFQSELYVVPVIVNQVDPAINNHTHKQKKLIQLAAQPVSTCATINAKFVVMTNYKNHNLRRTLVAIIQSAMWWRVAVCRRPACWYGS